MCEALECVYKELGSAKEETGQLGKTKHRVGELDRFGCCLFLARFDSEFLAVEDVSLSCVSNQAHDVT